MGETFARGLRSVERLDGVALVLLPSGAKHAALVEAAFPDRLSFTLSPAGEASVMLSEAALENRASLLPPGALIRRNLTVIRAAGVCMSAAENKARCICAALARSRIRLSALSLCDLALSFAVDTADADRAFALVSETVPLVW